MKAVLGKYKIDLFHTLCILCFIIFLHFIIYIKSIDKRINKVLKVVLLNEKKIFLKNDAI